MGEWLPCPFRVRHCRMSIPRARHPCPLSARFPVRFRFGSWERGPPAHVCPDSMGTEMSHEPPRFLCFQAPDFL